MSRSAASGFGVWNQTSPTGLALEFKSGKPGHSSFRPQGLSTRLVVSSWAAIGQLSGPSGRDAR